MEVYPDSSSPDSDELMMEKKKKKHHRDNVHNNGKKGKIGNFDLLSFKGEQYRFSGQSPSWHYTLLSYCLSACLDDGVFIALCSARNWHNVVKKYESLKRHLHCNIHSSLCVEGFRIRMQQHRDSIVAR